MPLAFSCVHWFVLYRLWEIFNQEATTSSEVVVQKWGFGKLEQDFVTCFLIALKDLIL